MAVVKAELAVGGRNIKGTFNGYYINRVGQWNVSGSVKYIAYSDTADDSPVRLAIECGHTARLPSLISMGNPRTDGAAFHFRLPDQVKIIS